MIISYIIAYFLPLFNSSKRATGEGGSVLERVVHSSQILIRPIHLIGHGLIAGLGGLLEIIPRNLPRRLVRLPCGLLALVKRHPRRLDGRLALRCVRDGPCIVQSILLCLECGHYAVGVGRERREYGHLSRIHGSLNASHRDRLRVLALALGTFAFAWQPGPDGRSG